jgi:predicted ABC-type ATPase
VGALDDLTVKLAAIKHVRDVGYWHLPWGTPLIAHPNVVHLAKAPPGSKAQTKQRELFTKVAPDQWRSEKSGKVLSNKQLVDGGLTRLAPPTHAPAQQQAVFGQAKKGQFKPQQALFKPPQPGSPQWKAAEAKWYEQQQAKQKPKVPKFVPITANQARGNSREVSAEEFQKIAVEGDARIKALMAASSSPDGLDRNWAKIKEDAYVESRKSWGGLTIDTHTGEPVVTTKDAYALTVKPPGVASVTVPEDATPEQFDKAMEKARRLFDRQFGSDKAHIGIFHDDDLHRIDIDPVLVVDNLHDVETIGAATHAIGGAYNFRDGNGYWPPHVERFRKNDRVEADGRPGLFVGKQNGDYVVSHKTGEKGVFEEKTYPRSAVLSEQEARAKHAEEERKARAAKVLADAEAARKLMAQQAEIKGELSDEQYAAHIDAVEKLLRQAKADGLETNVMHSKFGAYDAERSVQQKEIIRDLLDAQAKTAKKDHQMVIAGGLAGAGKTTVLTQSLGLDMNDWVTVNPDDMKVELARRGLVPDVEGLSPLEAASLVHQESVDMANALLRQAEDEGYNVIQDITMSSTQTINRRLNEAKKYGYHEPRGVFVDVPVDVSVDRAMSRYRRDMEAFRNGVGQGGRFVPPGLIRGQRQGRSTTSRNSFESTKGNFAAWQLWDNSGDAPARVESSSRWSGGSWTLTPEERVKPHDARRPPEPEPEQALFPWQKGAQW